jgi:hypothetical protein
MKGLRYFLTLALGIVVLAVGAWLLNTRYPDRPALVGATPVVPEQAPAPIATGVRDSAPPPAPPDVEAAPVAERSRAPVQGGRATPRVSRASAPSTVSGTSTAPRGSDGALASRTDSAVPAPTAKDPATIAADTTTPEPAPVWQASPRQVVRDSAYVMTSSGRLGAAIAVLDEWVRTHPTDTAVVLDLARLLARSGDWQGSIAQYTALIAFERTPQVLFERGQVYLWSGNAARGEADLIASEELRPQAETQRQLGDHYRWQGDFARSASWYRMALRSNPGDTLARQSLELLDRAIDARLLLPGEPGPGDAGSTAQIISDNAGFDLYSLRLGQGFALSKGSSSVATVTGELRSASNATAGGTEGHVDAYGADLGLSARLGTSKVSATIGVLDHGDADRMVRGVLAVDGFMGGARVRTSLRRAPAYELLWAPRLLGAALVSGSSLASAWQGQASLSLPLGQRAELWASGEHLRVSGDNTRVALQVALKRRLAGPLSIIYAGGVMTHDQQTAMYYSPARYLSQSLGAELSRYREEGVSFALRFAPGYAWIREPAGTLDLAERNVSAFQLTGGLELGYRRHGWDLLLTTGLGAGREGGYRSGSAMLSIRRSW